MKYEKNGKLYTLWLTVICMVFSWTAPILSNAQSNSYKLIYGEKVHKLINEPYENSRGFMVSAEELSNALGYEYKYDDTYGSFEIIMPDGNIMLMHEATHYYKGDESIECEPSFYVENGTWIELGFFCSLIGCDYGCDMNAKIIEIIEENDNPVYVQTEEKINLPDSAAQINPSSEEGEISLFASGGGSVPVFPYYKTYSGSVELETSAPGGLEIEFLLQPLRNVKAEYYGSRYYELGDTTVLGTLSFNEGQLTHDYSFNVYDSYGGYYDKYCVYLKILKNDIQRGLYQKTRYGYFEEIKSIPNLTGRYDYILTHDIASNSSSDYYIPEECISWKSVKGDIILPKAAPEGGIDLRLVLQEVGPTSTTYYGVDYYTTGYIHKMPGIHFESGEKIKPYEIVLDDYYRDYSVYNNYALYVMADENSIINEYSRVNKNSAASYITNIPGQIPTNAGFSFFSFEEDKNLDITISEKSHYCGENAQWSYDSDTKTLTISGSGDMFNYYTKSYTDEYGNERRLPNVEWIDYIDDIERVVVEEGIVSIGDNAFCHHESLKEVEIGCEVIRDSAFYNCPLLTKVTFTDNVKKVIGYAFGNNDTNNSISEVHISDIDAWCGIDFESSVSNPAAHGASMYVNSKLLEKLVVPEGVQEIKAYSFYNFDNLITAELPESVKSIEKYAFFGCDNLHNIKMPEKTERIGEYAFSACKNLSEINIPDGIEVIENHTFSKCDALRKVNIPESVTSINHSAFYACNSLLEVHITDLSAWCRISFEDPSANPLSNGASLYFNNESLTSITIPDGITEIKANAFYYFDALEEIIIPEGVEKIDSSAFYSCYNLRKISLPNTLKKVESYAFSYTGIEEVHIKDIGAWCNLEFVGHKANPLHNGGGLYVNLKPVENLIIPSGITKIQNHAFFGCSSITDITLPDGIERIESSAFYKCNNLKSIIIPNGMFYIKDSAFYDCYNLSYVIFGGSEDEWNEILLYSGNESIEDSKKIYNAKKRTYRFVTNSENSLANITSYGIMTMPYLESTNKTLVGWYDNKNLDGMPVSFPYFGSATTLYAAWTSKTGESFDKAFTARANSSYTVKPLTSGQMIYYSFVPEYSGEYTIYSQGNQDTYGYLYDSYGYKITSTAYGGDGSNFKIVYNLEAGETYYIGVKNRYSSSEFTLSIETDCYPSTKTVCVQAVTGEKIFTCIPMNLPSECRVILACYNKDNLVEIQSVPNENTEIYFVVSENFTDAKVMVWDSFDSMIPIVTAEIVK